MNRNNYATSGGDDAGLTDTGYDPFDLTAEQQAAKSDRAAFYQQQDSRHGHGDQLVQAASPPYQVPKAAVAPTAPEFEILNLRRHQGTGPTRAFFTLAVHFAKRKKGAVGDPLLLHDCRIVANKDGEPFVSTAQREWIDQQGKKQYTPIFDLPKSWKRLILDTAVEDAGGWPL